MVDCADEAASSSGVRREASACTRLQAISSLTGRIDLTLSYVTRSNRGLHSLMMVAILCCCALSQPVVTADQLIPEISCQSDSNFCSIPAINADLTSISNHGSVDQGANPGSSKSVSSGVNEGGLKMDVEDLPSVSWGLPDAVVAVGTLFHYDIPPAAFKGPVTDYTVTESGSSTLPPWLYFIPSPPSLEGVPGPLDLVAPSYPLRVAAQSPAGVMESFTVRVIPYSDTSDTPVTGGDTPIRCHRKSPVTSAVVMLDTDLDSLSASERVGLIRSAARHIGLPPGSLRFVDVVGGQDASALVAGPGDVIVPKFVGVVGLRWEVGCGGVAAPQMEILQHVEATAKNGEMSRAISRGVIGWQVTNRKPPGTGEMRMKRGVRLRVVATPTAEREVGPPSAKPVPTRVIPPAVTSSLSPPSVKPSKSKTPPVKPSRVSPPAPTRLVSASSAWEGVGTSPQPPTDPPNLEPSVEVRSTTQIGRRLTAALPSRPLVVTSEPTTTAVMTPPNFLKSSWGTTGGRATPKPTEGGAVAGVEMKKLHHISVGDVLLYKIPLSSFSEFSNGVVALTVALTMAPDGRALAADSWLRYDDIRHALLGAPWEGDAGVHRYWLTAVEPTTNRTQRIDVEMRVAVGGVAAWATHEMWVGLDVGAVGYDGFVKDAKQRVEVAGKIAAAFGDRTADALSLTRMERGSVVLAWTNRTLAGESCRARDINALADVIVGQSEASVNPSFVAALRPYSVLSAGVFPRGACMGFVASREGVALPPRGPHHDGGVDSDDPKGRERPDAKPKTADGQSNLPIILSVILVLVFVMVIVAIVLICYRKRQRDKKKMAVADGNNLAGAAAPGAAGGAKQRGGVPIIFADELDDRPAGGAAPGGGRGRPLMGGERPPMPPGYQQVVGVSAGEMPGTPRGQRGPGEPLISRGRGRENEGGGKAGVHKAASKQYRS